jgi:hypothetical protein
MKNFTQWNTQRFAVCGALLGAAYGLGMSAVVGISSMRTLDLLIWALVFSASFGAAIGGGLAVLRNMLAFYVLQARPAPTRPEPRGFGNFHPAR